MWKTRRPTLSPLPQAGHRSWTLEPWVRTKHMCKGTCEAWGHWIRVLSGFLPLSMGPSLFLKLINLFGCVGSWMWLAGSSLSHVGSLAVAHQTQELWRESAVVRGSFSSPTRNQTGVPCSVRLIFNHWTTRKFQAHPLASLWPRLGKKECGVSAAKGP